MHAGSVVPEGKRQLERTGCSWDGDTTVKCKAIGWEGGERDK